LILLLVLFTSPFSLTFALAAGSPRPVILVVGDSLSAAYQINPDQGWVNLLQQRLDQQGMDYQVINASISGDTTLGGLSRLPAALKRHTPEIVIIELGANDGLRGLPIIDMQENLAQMIRLSEAASARVLLLGMQLPPNYGPTYTRSFYECFQTLARTYHVGLVPFFLSGVAEQRSLMQDDNLHPTAQAQPLLLDNVWPLLQPLLIASIQPASNDK